MSQSQSIECPNCHSKAVLKQLVKKVPFFGKLLFSTIDCDNCGFKLSDVFSLEFKEPMQYSVIVENEKDLNTKIVKSSTATIKIPKLGVLIEPGVASEGYFTNIEGLLQRIEQVAKILVNTAKHPKEVKAAEKALEKIRKARNAELSFKVIIQDPFGNSALIGKKVKKKKLSSKQASKLKKPLIVLEKS